MYPKLIHEGNNDYQMPETLPSCWITVGNISVYIVQRPSRCVVELYAKGNEDMDIACIDRAVMTYDQAKIIEEEYR